MMFTPDQMNESQIDDQINKNGQMKYHNDRQDVIEIIGFETHIHDEWYTVDSEPTNEVFKNLPRRVIIIPFDQTQMIQS